MTIDVLRNYPDVDLLRFGEFVFGPVLRGQSDVETLIDSVLGDLPFSLVHAVTTLFLHSLL